jgi:DNA invertase Pin-like site-specific DNA recombinase
VVWKLDRAGRSLTHLIELLKDLQERGIEFISLTKQIDTTTPGGKLIFHLMGALAEFERDLIRERTIAGLAAARARERVGGRPVIHSRPTGKSHWLGACSLTRVIPSRKSVRLSGSPALLDIGT